MQRFRDWRESLRSSSRPQPAKESHPPQPAPTVKKETTPTPTIPTPAPAPTPTPLSFAELERLRRDRHAIFVNLLADPETFAQFLRFLSPIEQHELLFICEINQLLEKATEWEEAEIFTQAIKIANIFLRNADSSSPEPPPPSSPSSSSHLPASQAQPDNIDASVLQIQSIQPATRRHLQSCIPLTLPSHLQPSHGGNSASPTPNPSTPASTVNPYLPGNYQPKTDTKVILTMLEVARDQVEESISKKSLQRFLDFQSSLIGGQVMIDDSTRADMIQTANVLADGGGLGLHWEYTFDDCCVAVTAADQSLEGSLAYVYRSFLLYLMEDRRHRILCSWSDVQRVLSMVRDIDLDPDGSIDDSVIMSSSGVHPSTSLQELTRGGDTPHETSNNQHSTLSPQSPASAPVAIAHISASSSSSSLSSNFSQPRSLSQLYTLYMCLEDVYHRFFPDQPLQSPQFFIRDASSGSADADDKLTDALIEQLTSPASASTLASDTEIESVPLILSQIANPFDPKLYHANRIIESEIDSHATVVEIETLRGSIRDLISKLRPMCVKMDKILRYTFWPQFCKSEYFHQLSKITRPMASVRRSSSSRRNSLTHSGRTSRRGSGDIPTLNNLLLQHPTPTSTSGSTLSVSPPVPTSNTLSPPAPSSISQAPPSKPSLARLKHSLVSSLKQHKVTREMLVLESADWKQVKARRHKRMNVGIIDIPSNAAPTSTNSHSAPDTDADVSLSVSPSPAPVPVPTPVPTPTPASGPNSRSVDVDPDRLLEYVCVLKSTPVLPPRSNTDDKSHDSYRPSPNPAAPPLPPRPSQTKSPQSASASSSSTSPMPSSPLPNKSASNAPPALNTIVRGGQSITPFYRYPLVDHSHTKFPAHLVDLAFPLLPDSRHQENFCTCPHPTIGMIQWVEDTSTTIDKNVDTKNESTPAPAPTPASLPGMDSSASPSVASATNTVAISIADSTPLVSYRDGLFNIVCTQEDGSVLHGCVLQLTQFETVDESWEEEVYPVMKSKPTKRDVGAAQAVGDASSNGISSGVMNSAASTTSGASTSIGMGIGIGADLLHRDRHLSGVLTTPTKSVGVAAATSTVGNNIHLRTSALALSSPSASPPPPMVNTSTAESNPSIQPAPSPSKSKLSTLFDDFAKDMRKVVERAANEFSSHSSQQNRTSSTDASDAASSAAASSSSATIPTALPVPADSATDAVGTIAASANVHDPPANSDASTLSVPPPSTSDPTDPDASSGLVTPPRRRSSASGPGSSSLASSPSRTAPHRVARHRVLRVEVHYAIVVLTRHPLYNLLRQALTSLIEHVTDEDTKNTEMSDATKLSEVDRQQWLTTFPPSACAPLSISSSTITPILQGSLRDLFHSTPFLRLLSSTHLPSQRMDLFHRLPHLADPSCLIVPPVDCEFDVLFKSMNMKRILLVLECLISERRVLLVSSSTNLLSLAGTCLLALLYPFQWKYLYIPILPASLFKYLQCPTPFLMGIHACYRQKAHDIVEKEDVVWVDLDKDEVIIPTQKLKKHHSHHRSRASSIADRDATIYNSTNESTIPIDSPFHLPTSVRHQLLAQVTPLFDDEPSQPLLADAHNAKSPRSSSTNLDASSSSFLLPSSIPLSPVKPPVDIESHKIIDPYGHAEAETGAGIISKLEAESAIKSDEADLGTEHGQDGQSGEGHSSKEDDFESSLPATAADVSVDADDQSAENLPAPSTDSLPSSHRSLLFQLELLKVWSHLLKNYRQFVISLPAPDHGFILIFDTPSFIASKPSHYQPFLHHLFTTNFLPSFLYDRSRPMIVDPLLVTMTTGLEPIERDGFDRYEASLSQERVNIWKQAYAYQRQEQQHNASSNEPSNSNLSSTSSAFAAWCQRYSSTGMDPSLHHRQYLIGWNSHKHMKWTEIVNKL